MNTAWKTFLEALSRFLSPKPEPIYGIAKFVRSTDATNLQYVVEAFNVNEYVKDKAVAHLNAMPEGSRALFIGGAALYLNRQFDDVGGYAGPWMDEWAGQVASNMGRIAQELKDAGAKVDYLMVDYEEKGPAQYELNTQGAGVWTAIMADARWPKLRADLGLTDEEFKKALNKNGLLILNKDNQNPVGIRWNTVMEDYRIAYFHTAIYEPFAKCFPGVKVGSYEDGLRSDTNPTQANCFRFTNTWGSKGAILKYPHFLTSENMRFGQNSNTPQGDIFTVKDDWTALVASVQLARANVQVDRRRSLHWVTGIDYYNTPTAIGKNFWVGQYYKELLFQLVMNGAQHLFLQTSAWSTK